MNSITEEINTSLENEKIPDFVSEELPKEEARKLKMAYVTFNYTSSAGSQTASSSNNTSSAEVPNFKVFAPFLNATIGINNNNNVYFYSYTQGRLKKGKDDKTFVVENYNSSYELPEVEVTYEE